MVADGGHQGLAKDEGEGLGGQCGVGADNPGDEVAHGAQRRRRGKNVAVAVAGVEMVEW